MDPIANQLATVLSRIRAAEQRYQREPGSVKLLAVTKQQSAATIRKTLTYGQYEYGENYLQEAQLKINELHDEPITWHFIGQLQANKTKAIAAQFSWVHSVDRLVLAQRLSAARVLLDLPPLQICLQVNVLAAAQKAGVTIAAVKPLIDAIQELPGLQLRGLMCIPDSGTEQIAFKQLKQLFDGLNQTGYQLDTLSMGMSTDLELAIAAGSTLVRVGSAIFGERSVTSGII